MRSPFKTFVQIWRVQSFLSALLWVFSLGDIVFWIIRGWGCPLVSYFDAFQDLVIYQSRFTFFHTAAFFQARIVDSRFEWPPSAFSYPPAAALLYSAFYRSSQPEAIYTALMVMWCGLCVFAVFKRLAPLLPANTSKFAVPASLVLFSFPAVFLAERANLELFVWISLTVGVLLYARGNLHGAAVFFGLAASIKIYPLILLGLFLNRRRWWSPLLTGLASALAVTLLAMWYCGPGFVLAMHGFIEGLLRFKTDHAEAARIMEAPFDHSLFAAIKAFYLTGEASPARWAMPYYALSMGTAAIVFFLRVRRFPFLNRLTFLTVAMIVLPPVSYEYTIIHLYLPLLSLTSILLTTYKDRAGVATSVLVAFGSLLLAMTPIGMLANGRFAYAGLVQLAALLCVAAASTVSPWPSPRTTPLSRMEVLQHDPVPLHCIA